VGWGAAAGIAMAASLTRRLTSPARERSEPPNRAIREDATDASLPRGMSDEIADRAVRRLSKVGERAAGKGESNIVGEGA
jgi:hypothetical protein